jgi:hypothetical protein
VFKKLTLSLTLFLLSAAPVFGSCKSNFFSQTVSSCALSPKYTIYEKEKFVGLEGKLGIFTTDYKEGAGIRAGFEKSLESSLKGASLGFELRPEILVFGANFVYHWGEGEKEWKFAPEIGIGWSYVSLVYHYGLHMSGDKIASIGNHGVTFSVNIPF